MNVSFSNDGRKKVFVGLSGGVDSSVSAALLVREGYDVIGVFIKVWQPDFIECTWREDRLDAMRVASHLDIPFITLDLEKEYKEGVIDYMISEYKEGRTPNPDVMCNREVKFGAFYRWAKEQDLDAYIATGHYASHNGTSLLMSADENKDQTYFLWTLKKELFSSILFPVGTMKKSDVRSLAQNYGLPVATKKDSQGLCFVGTIDVKTLLKKYIEEKRGDVINLHKEVVGYHEGVMFYTIGERHGFVITKKSTEDKPYYVVQKNVARNVLVVSHEKPQEPVGGNMELRNENWTVTPIAGKIYTARSRYRAALSQVEFLYGGHVKVLGGGLVITSGQSLVVYDGNVCIGGGVIL
jgi:tRNA-specific 2-thiouridylase